MFLCNKQLKNSELLQTMIVQSQPGILSNYIRIMQINGTVKNMHITSVFYFHSSWSNIYVRSTTWFVIGQCYNVHGFISTVEIP
jgi:hypothetical protein